MQQQQIVNALRGGQANYNEQDDKGGTFAAQIRYRKYQIDGGNLPFEVWYQAGEPAPESL